MNAERLPDAEVLYAHLLSVLRDKAGGIDADTAIVGIVTGGAWLAERLRQDMALQTPLGALDVAFYRDDFGKSGLKKSVRPSQIPFDVDGRNILLVDDVLYTGRTVRAAMNELFDYGRPARIDLAVLVDRGGRELPVAARYCGGSVEVPAGKVLLLEREADSRLVLQLSEKRRKRSAPA